MARTTGKKNRKKKARKTFLSGLPMRDKARRDFKERKRKSSKK